MNSSACEKSFERYIHHKYGERVKVIVVLKNSGGGFVRREGNNIIIETDKTFLLSSVMKQIDAIFSNKLFVVYLLGEGVYSTFFNEKEARDFGEENTLPGDKYDLRVITKDQQLDFGGDIVSFNDAIKVIK